VVKVVWHKAASSLHTDSSIIFAKWRQYAPTTTTQFIGTHKCVLQTASCSVQWGSECQCLPSCQSWWRLVEPLATCGYLTVFKIAVIRHLGIFKFGILSADKVKRVNMCHRAKLFRLSKRRPSGLIATRPKKVKMHQCTKFHLLIWRYFVYFSKWQPFLQGSRLWQTDRQTNRPRYLVYNKPHLAYAAMRPKKFWAKPS